MYLPANRRKNKHSATWLRNPKPKRFLATVFGEQKGTGTMSPDFINIKSVLR